MHKGYHYKCPYESTCKVHKHCHVLKTIEQLQNVITVLVKCPAENNKEILVNIGVDKNKT